MTKRNLKEALNRIVSYTAQSEELSAFDQFIHYQQNKVGTPSKEVGEHIWSSVEKKIKPKKAVTLQTLLKIAASVTIIFAFGLALYLNQSVKDESVMIIVKTELGQKKSIQLSDGSVVKMNSGSSLEYPKVFIGDTRQVSLRGEAFFDIAKNPQLPFIVTSSNIETKVLGTSFNIKAHDSLNISVALVSGRVEVRNTETEEVQRITPGQLIKYNNGFMVSEFEQKEMIAWKDGLLYLKKATADQVFEKLASWYGVSFEFKNKPSDKWSYSGEFEDMTLETVLNTISYSKRFQFQIDKNKVYVEFKK